MKFRILKTNLLLPGGEIREFFRIQKKSFWFIWEYVGLEPSFESALKRIEVEKIKDVVVYDSSISSPRGPGPGIMAPCSHYWTIDWATVHLPNSVMTCSKCCETHKVNPK